MIKIKDFKNLIATDIEYEYVDTLSDEAILENQYKKIKIRHKKCNNVFETCYKYFRVGRRCPYCAGLYKTTNSVKEEVKNKTNGEYKLTGEYTGCHDKLEILHTKCNKTFNTTYTRFFGKKENKQANRCPYCSHGHTLKSIEELKKEVEEKSNNEYTILSTSYTGNKDKVEFKHISCGHTFMMRPNGFLSSGYRCPYCFSKSKGEDKIREYLLKNNITFLEQYKIPECKDKRPLPFDFKVDCNNSYFLIEYQGIQHFDTRKPFSKYNLHQHDIIKKDYCEKNNITLLIIPYTEFENIEKILNETISTTISKESTLK